MSLHLEYRTEVSIAERVHFIQSNLVLMESDPQDFTWGISEVTVCFRRAYRFVDLGYTWALNTIILQGGLRRIGLIRREKKTRCGNSEHRGTCSCMRLGVAHPNASDKFIPSHIRRPGIPHPKELQEQTAIVLGITCFQATTRLRLTYFSDRY